MNLSTVVILLAVVCFFLAALRVQSRFDLQAAGFGFLALRVAVGLL